jgi:hypothetical protein
MSGTPAQFATFLRTHAKNAPAAVEAGLREGARILLANAVEKTPVDQAQMKASWRAYDIPGGALVTNLASHAVFIERGRGPGPVPFAPIKAWAARHGIPDGAVFAIVKKLEAVGYEPKWPLKLAIVDSRRGITDAIKRHLAKVAS